MADTEKTTNADTADTADTSTEQKTDNTFYLFIQNQEKVYMPCVPESVTWELSRFGAAGKLTFSVIQDDVLDFEEGNVVTMGIGKTDLFKGYVFTRREDKNGQIKVTAYDQLRYLKNKEIYAFVGKTAQQIIIQIANDFKLNHTTAKGEEAIADTKYVIPKFRASNETLFDTIQKALDHTLLYGEGNTGTDEQGDTVRLSGKMFILYDNAGVLSLSEVGALDVPILIDSETAENFTFESSIDGEVYNMIMLYEDDKEAGKRNRYPAKSEINIAKWGVLQLTESVDTKKCADPNGKAQRLLEQYNAAKKTLSISGAMGDVRVRDGSRVWVRLSVHDKDINLAPNQKETDSEGKTVESPSAVQMLVEHVTHKFEHGRHSMDLTLVGRGIKA